LGKKEFYAGGDVIIFRQDTQNSLFLAYLINSYSFREQKAKLAKGDIIVHIYSSQIKDIRFALPPLEEQKAIAEYIEKETARIDTKIAKTKRIIELQKEYRTALISEAVTGKIKIPDLTELDQ
jgi:type I restriction enzyme S subunit